MPELLITYLLHEIGQKLLVLCQNQVPCFHRGDFWREQKFQVVSVHQPRHSESTEVAKITNFWPLFHGPRASADGPQKTARARGGTRSRLITQKPSTKQSCVQPLNKSHKGNGQSSILSKTVPTISPSLPRWP